MVPFNHLMSRAMPYSTPYVRGHWATEAEVAELPRRLLEWGERPDAFFGVLKCGAVAWVGPQQSP
jgi:hypothetical protein